TRPATSLALSSTRSPSHDRDTKAADLSTSESYVAALRFETGRRGYRHPVRPESREAMTTNVKRCECCGNDHVDVEAFPLPAPIPQPSLLEDGATVLYT